MDDLPEEIFEFDIARNSTAADMVVDQCLSGYFTIGQSGSIESPRLDFIGVEYHPIRIENQRLVTPQIQFGSFIQLADLGVPLAKLRPRFPARRLGWNSSSNPA